ncbi:SDR family NAD(P)-dependent oxidoreductase [Fluviispira vulneris]|uniref:SDR family NAD(P)-dependent oxidoreductase n=1 Tax=Fluviispira vulneris TaxID=2763012 RepID=UPI0016455269|nr:SDR family NAD(P)-dependent oxidoreductase [Fluviispira vulneris]
MSVEKWIIGTGFSRGIGYELAKILKDNNYKIVHMGRKRSEFEDVFVWWDLLNPISDSPFPELSKSIYGKAIVGFIHCAGVMPILQVSETNRMEKHLFWQSQAEAMRINYFSCAEIIEDILPFMMSHTDNGSQNPPFVAHLSSLSAVDPFPNLELYGATKSACLLYFKWLSYRFAFDELNCLSIHPGTVHTDMVSNVISNESSDLEVVKKYKELINKNEMLTPQAAAENIYKFLFIDIKARESAHGKLYLSDKATVYK